VCVCVPSSLRPQARAEEEGPAADEVLQQQGREGGVRR
jgi:hypothetical protein